MKQKFILLHPRDNVLICCRQAGANETIIIDKQEIALLQEMKLGHKVARRSLFSGDKIIKYGVSIGSATQAVSPGEHVHLHNMKSDYITPTTRKPPKDDGDHE